MTEHSDAPAAAAAKKRGGGLANMLLADLKSMAGGMGIDGAGSMKKAQLVDAIKAAQAGASTPRSDKPAQGSNEPKVALTERRRTRQRGTDQQAATSQPSRGEGDTQRDPARQESAQQQSPLTDQQPKQKKQQSEQKQGEQKQQLEQKQGEQKQQLEQKQGEQKQQLEQKQDGQKQQPESDDDGDAAEGGSRRNRRRRGRDRQANRAPSARNEPDTTVLEDDVLVPAAGILDVLDNYAFVRTSGYLPGTDDVYLSLSIVRKFGLRRGDAVVGQVRQPREGERKEKFNPMVRVDSVNGTDPEAARERLEFESFTPVHPTDRLRLETDAANLTGRLVDVAAPLGKGQRGLIVAPPKSGRTTLLRSIAQSISRNNPEAHLMVVLLDARPEEVTDFQREVKGEVIASTFDRPATDHTTLAELAIERAKRLVELGHDVVLLLDSLTSLGRAYNVSVPASGRQLAGGVDAAAVHPPKRLFGAARKVEGGGSLTVLATILADTGWPTDEAILEEFTATANLELRLRRELAQAGIFPAIDVAASGTRHEEVLIGEQEAGILAALRSRMSSEPAEGVASLMADLRKAPTNLVFLTGLDSRRG